MLDIFNQNLCNNGICYTSNLSFNHKDIVINCFMIGKQSSRKKKQNIIKNLLLNKTINKRLELCQKILLFLHAIKPN